MSWKGVKSALPSKVGFWPSSKRKAAKQNGNSKDASRYFSNGSAQSSTLSVVDSQLDKAFDALRSGDDSKDAIGVESSMTYLQNLNVNLENASLFVALEFFQAPSIGEITRKGFVEGWKNSGVTITQEGCAAHVKSLVSTLSRNPGYFKQVYRFLKEKWTRSVNRDMWNMTLEFALRSMTDETLSFWSEDGAWPSVIDEFVAWCRDSHGIGKAKGQDTMEVED
ncbi:unnamed protein product [Parascedosporium putredinis]|uniref:Defective in cullin neddylation protein n=1 Tax=Parascedosporium putredinis TaxID=1442378 RepID=A0A9P1HAM1_9PEZI|nr:unnamed protein product [Parascedosporium putredinis]CAI8002848.1 unnamed protein product [Parascedosporium putredinis]